MPLYYYSIEPQSKRFPSKGDIVTFKKNNNTHRGQVISSCPEYVNVKLDMSDNIQRVERPLVQVVEKHSDRLISGVPVEVNDLVSLVYEGQPCNAIILQVNVASSTVVIRVISKPINKNLTIHISNISFWAKGFSPASEPMRRMQQAQMQRIPPTYSQPQLMTSISPNSQVSIPVMNQQSYHQRYPIDVVMVDAPCVVKVVSKDGNLYDDVMQVELDQDSPDIPSVLPLIRMTCGTILVVRSPESSTF